MPLFDYKCVKCANVFDILVRLKDIDKPIECPKCNSSDVKKVISKFNHKFNCGGLNEDYAVRGNG